MKTTRFFRERDWNELKMYKEQMELIKSNDPNTSASMAAMFHLSAINQEMSDRAYSSLRFLEDLEERENNREPRSNLTGLSAILYGKE